VPLVRLEPDQRHIGPVLGPTVAVDHSRRGRARGPGRSVHQGRVRVVVEVAFTGRTTAGRPVAFDVFGLAPGSGRIRRLSTWYDTAAVRRQVGGG
jgi:hypothetical protein